MLVSFLVNIFHTFLILANSGFYINEHLKWTDCLQKCFDGIFILPDKVSFELSTALFSAVTRATAIFMTFQKYLLLAENAILFNDPVCSFFFRAMWKSTHINPF